MVARTKKESQRIRLAHVQEQAGLQGFQRVQFGADSGTPRLALRVNFGPEAHHCAPHASRGNARGEREAREARGERLAQVVAHQLGNVRAFPGVVAGHRSGSGSEGRRARRGSKGRLGAIDFLTRHLREAGDFGLSREVRELIHKFF